MPHDADEAGQAMRTLLGELLGETAHLDASEHLAEFPQALALAHELATMLHEIAGHPTFPLLFGPQAAQLGEAIALVAHYVTCPHRGEETNKEQHVWEPSKPLIP
jgi:hypothetical protein